MATGMCCCGVAIAMYVPPHPAALLWPVFDEAVAAQVVAAPSYSPQAMSDATKRATPGTPVGGERQIGTKVSPVPNAEKVARLSAVKFQLNTPPPLPGASASQQDAESMETEQGERKQGDAEVKDSDMKAMMNQMTQMMTMMSNLSGDMQAVRTTVQQADVKADQAMEIAQRVEVTTSELQKNSVNKHEVQDMINVAVLEEIDKKLADIQGKTIHKTQTNTIVLGGFDTTFDKVETWVPEQVAKIGAKMPSAVYHKGEEFKGLVFLKFDSYTEAGQMIDKWASAKPEHMGKTILVQ